MNRHVYNGSILVGVLLVSIGAGLVYVPAGLMVGGALVLGFTLFGARLAAGARG